MRLAAQLAFGAHFAGDPSHLAGEAVELIHHGVDGVLELQNLAAHIHRNLAGEVAVGHRRGDRRDVTDLAGQITGHQVHAVGEILPGTGHARHIGLTTEAPFGTHLARHPGHLAGEAVELVHHGVDGFLELQHLAAYIGGDLLGEVTVGHGGGHLGDVSNLAGEVAGHGVHGIGQVFPGSRHARYLGLHTELALGAHLAGHPGHLAGEAVELIHHAVDHVLDLEDLALYLHGNLLAQVAGGDGGRNLGDVP